MTLIEIWNDIYVPAPDWVWEHVTPTENGEPLHLADWTGIDPIGDWADMRLRNIQSDWRIKEATR